MLLFYDLIDTPLGPMSLVCDTVAVRYLNFIDDRATDRQCRQQDFVDHTLVDLANPRGFSDRIRDYFGGDVHALECIPTEPGGTPFQQQVWNALRNIPAGSTISYSEQAAAIGRPRATRAVGMTNGRNPICLILPCHRVIGRNGRLTGYAGGLMRKQWLLDFEQRHASLFPQEPVMARIG